MTEINTKENNKTLKKPSDIGYAAIALSYSYAIELVARSTIGGYVPLKVPGTFIPPALATFKLIEDNCFGSESKTEWKAEALVGTSIALVAPSILVACQVSMPITVAAFVGYSLLSENTKEHYSVSLRENVKHVIEWLNPTKEFSAADKPQSLGAEKLRFLEIKSKRAAARAHSEDFKIGLKESTKHATEPLNPTEEATATIDAKTSPTDTNAKTKNTVVWQLTKLKWTPKEKADAKDADYVTELGIGIIAGRRTWLFNNEG